MMNEYDRELINSLKIARGIAAGFSALLALCAVCYITSDFPGWILATLMGAASLLALRAALSMDDSIKAVRRDIEHRNGGWPE